MKENKTDSKKNYDKLIRVLQILAVIFTLAMLVTFVVLMKKYNISVSNVSSITEKLTGGIITVAAMIIVLNIVKSFALVVTPSIIFVISGIVFDDLWVAIVVNLIALATGSIFPYFLGKFTGSGMVDTLRNRFPKVKKLDDFAGKNEFIICFVIKASGLIPGDLTSLIFGAMNISFTKYYLGSFFGTVPIAVMWAVLGNKGDLSNPYTVLYLLPIIIFAVVMSFVVKKVSSKKTNESADSAAE